jgi:L-fuculose-phosphate aldolase
MSEEALRQEIVDTMRALDASGLNRGSSGNVSARLGGDAMLVTPSGIPPGRIEPRMVARMRLSDESVAWEGPCKPSVEWRFHRDLLRARPDINAIVHTHAPYSTILAIARKPIPAIHYMMAAFGGPDIRCAGYARYGTPELSREVVAAMEGRTGALMANHGMIVGGPNLGKAAGLAAELEALAHQYYHVLAIGGGHMLTDSQIEETAAGFATYGVQDPEVASG